MPKDNKDNKKGKSGATPSAEALREEWETDAEAFRALGDPTRLAVLAFLRRRLAEEGRSLAAAAAMTPPQHEDEEEDEGDDPASGVGSATVGEVSCHLYGTEKVPSNLSHHLKELRRAGLITMKRRGKHVLCRLDRDALAGLFARQTADTGGEANATDAANAASANSFALSALIPLAADLPAPGGAAEDEDEQDFRGAGSAGALAGAPGA